MLSTQSTANIAEDFQATLQTLLKEEKKGSRIQVPSSLLETVSKYQNAYKTKFDRKISRENVMLLMMRFGKAAVEAEALKMIAQSSN